MLKIIGATRDLVKRGEIVAVVASGMEIERAINEVLSDPETKEAAGVVKEVGDPNKKAGVELTDEEQLHLKSLCEETLSWR
jgi:hypothetical protein